MPNSEFGSEESYDSQALKQQPKPKPSGALSKVACPRARVSKPSKTCSRSFRHVWLATFPRWLEARQSKPAGPLLLHCIPCKKFFANKLNNINVAVQLLRDFDKRFPPDELLESFSIFYP